MDKDSDRRTSYIRRRIRLWIKTEREAIDMYGRPPRKKRGVV